ncbi:4-hydroxy-tetrahydrodipicolinate synthase [Alistipes putredinis]|uniref:4-hydroxy-tetrahydrodipicolinate synthase n=1 Tax=Alistipes putredinis TaxID=28117 RepID=UPI001E438841|nr:4-hydroxy-tetrahydrodipicolinate synthase [Alistipes putredinis]
MDFIVQLGTTAEPRPSTCTNGPLSPCSSKPHRRARAAGDRRRRQLDLGSARPVARIRPRGADAILSVTPYYNKPSQEGLYQHFKTVSEHSPLPIILYNVPGRTGVNMTAATTIRIAGDFPNVIGIKEASGKIDQIQEILDWRSRDFLVLSGDDALTLDLMSRGADGVISVAVNAFPRKMMTCIDLAKKGDFEGAHKAYECLEEAVTALFAEGNPTGVKCAMSVLGLIGNTLRLPLVPGTPQLEARFKELIAKYDLN